MRLRAERLLLLALLAVLGAGEVIVVYAWNPGPRVPTLQVGYGVVTGVIVFYLAWTTQDSPRATPPWAVPALLAGAFLITLVIAQFALEAFPVSGDEYGYNYLAETLRRGRLWNPAVPEPLRDVLETSYVGGYGDKRLAVYPPAWPLVLAPFQALGIPQFADAVVGVGCGIMMLLALRDVPTSGRARLALLVLYVLAPFTVFNDASFYNHPLAAFLLLAIIWLDGRDALRPSPWYRAGIGLAFSVLLATRYEVVALCAIPFAIDQLWRRRAGFVVWALPTALGALPLTLLFLAYNWRITGSPFILTEHWILPDIGYGLASTGVAGQHSLSGAVENTVRWFGAWQDVVCTLFLPLYAVALWRRIRTRTLRWFDLLFPIVVAFFFFFPDYGGFQYGPRYWQIGFVAMPITLAAGLPLAGEAWRIGRWRLDPLRLAGAQLAAFAGFGLVYAGFLYFQTENRLVPLHLARSAPPPSMVLVPRLGRRYLPWQNYPYQLDPRDYTRNGLDQLGPTVIGLDLGDPRTALLCQQVPDRAIYRMRLDRTGPGGSLEPVCNGARTQPPIEGTNAR